MTKPTWIEHRKGGHDFWYPYHRFGSLGAIFATPITDFALSAHFLLPLSHILLSRARLWWFLLPLSQSWLSRLTCCYPYHTFYSLGLGFNYFCNPYHRFGSLGLMFDDCCCPITDVALSSPCLLPLSQIWLSRLIFCYPISQILLSRARLWWFLLPLSQIWLSRLIFCDPYHIFGSLAFIFVTPITTPITYFARL